MRTTFLISTFLCLAALGGARAAEVASVIPENSLPEARQPQAAVDPAGKVYVVFGVRNAVHCAVSADGSKSFTAVVKVGDTGSLSLGMRRGPRIAASKTAVVVTAIGGKVGKGQDGDLLAWRSKDGGKTWQGPERVNGMADSAREGLHGMAVSPEGRFCCVWLDDRTGPKRVYAAFSPDDGKTWEGEKLVYESPDGPVCPCCQPSVAYDAAGGLHVMWRNALSGDRDMYLIDSRDGGKTFGKAAKLGNGRWHLDACPMDGGGLAADADGWLTTVWRRDKEMFRCVPGRAEELLGRGEQGWAAPGTDGVYLVWIEARPGTLRLLKPGSDKPVTLAERAWDPVVAGPLDGKGPVIAAWEEGQPGKMNLRALALTR
jgi:hypothetical protein